MSAGREAAQDMKTQDAAGAAEGDPERQAAEQRCIRHGADPRAVAAWTDEEVRRFITLASYAKAPELSAAQVRTLQALAPRIPGHQGGQLSLGADLLGLKDLLREEFGLDVAPDGLIEVDPLTPQVQALIGDLPIAMFHHTATALLAAIAREGLRVGKQTNYFNTQAGCYLSTLRAGSPVELYQRIAARKHGGEPVAIRVRRRLSDLTPDPDDADLDWARGRQFVTPAVPPHDLADPELGARFAEFALDAGARPQKGAAPSEPDRPRQS